MPGKPFQSKLKPYEDEIFAQLDAGRSFRQVAEALNRAHALGVTHNAVFSFAKSRRKRRGARLFYEEFSPDIRDQLLKQVTAVWTHDSTALEGNTLTLGDTVKILESKKRGRQDQPRFPARAPASGHRPFLGSSAGRMAADPRSG